MCNASQLPPDRLVQRIRGVAHRPYDTVKNKTVLYQALQVYLWEVYLKSNSSRKAGGPPPLLFVVWDASPAKLLRYVIMHRAVHLALLLLLLQGCSDMSSRAGLCV